jgi:hypothetical protein
MTLAHRWPTIINLLFFFLIIGLDMNFFPHVSRYSTATLTWYMSMQEMKSYT